MDTDRPGIPQGTAGAYSLSRRQLGLGLYKAMLRLIQVAESQAPVECPIGQTQNHLKVRGVDALKATLDAIDAAGHGGIPLLEQTHPGLDLEHIAGDTVRPSRRLHAGSAGLGCRVRRPCRPVNSARHQSL